MRVLYIACSCSPVYGSEDTIGWNIPFQAVEKGHEVYVIVRSGLKKDIEDYLEREAVEKAPKFFFIETSEFLKRIAKGPFYTLRLYEFSKRALRMAEQLCQQYNIDVVHQITPVEFRSIGDYGSIPNVKYIVGPIAGGQKIHPLLWPYSKDKFSECLRLVVNELVIRSKQYHRKIKKVHTVLFANYETKEFFEQHRLESKNSVVIPDIGVLQNENPVTHGKKEKVVFLMVGRIISIKGIDIVLDALKYIDSDEYVVRICGEGKLKKKIQARIVKEKLESKVELVGFVDYHKMKEEYDNASALLMPSLREATGMVLAEAMSNGVPVITFEQFGAKIILSEDSGWLIPVEHSTEECVVKMAKAMEEVIKNPQKAMQKGLNARSAIEEYSWPRKYQCCEDVYQKALHDGE